MADNTDSVKLERWLPQIEREHLTTDDPGPDSHAWTGWFCLASGCVEDKHDSYGECVNCGEPVVRVWMVAP